MKLWRKRILAGMIVLCFAALSSGCTFGEKEEEKANLEFTVVDEERLPEELKEMIDDKKAEAFKMTFADGGYLYLCIGYGKQSTGGYSITVDDLYATENAIYLDTNLIGPKDVTEKGNQASYPYIVVKTPFMDKTVVFD